MQKESLELLDWLVLHTFIYVISTTKCFRAVLELILLRVRNNNNIYPLKLKECMKSQGHYEGNSMTSGFARSIWYKTSGCPDSCWFWCAFSKASRYRRHPGCWEGGSIRLYMCRTNRSACIAALDFFSSSSGLPRLRSPSFSPMSLHTTFQVAHQVDDRCRLHRQSLLPRFSYVEGPQKGLHKVLDAPRSTPWNG